MVRGASQSSITRTISVNDHSFVVTPAAIVGVIFGDDRSIFGKPEELARRRVYVTGTISLYRKTPEIILGDPAQLEPQP